MKATLIYFFSLFIIASGAIAQTHHKDTVLTKGLQVIIDGRHGGTYSAHELLNSKGLELTDTMYHVIEFKMSIAGKDVEYREFEGRGNELNDAMRAAIKGMPSGSKIYFEFIKCATKDNVTRLLSPVQVTLK